MGGGCEGLFFGGCLCGGLEFSLLDFPCVFLLSHPTPPSVDPARVLNMPPVIYVPVGIHGYIRCPVDAEPPATVVKWNKDGRPLQVEKVLERRMWGPQEMHPPDTKGLPLRVWVLPGTLPGSSGKHRAASHGGPQLAGRRDTPPQGSCFCPACPQRG